MKIVLIICTRDRLTSLKDCLCSVERCNVPQGAKLYCLVADNSDSGSAAQLCQERKASLGQDNLHYLNQRGEGYVIIRNAALDYACNTFALEDEDILVFIDDDVILDAKNLLYHVKTLMDCGADVSAGPNGNNSKERVKRKIKKVHTTNVALKAWIVESLRFAPLCNLTGCEDHEFFYDARERGARIMQTPKAKVSANSLEQENRGSIELISYVCARNALFITRRRRGLWAAVGHFMNLYFPRVLRMVALRFRLLVMRTQKTYAQAKLNEAILKGAFDGLYKVGCSRIAAKRGEIIPVE